MKEALMFISEKTGDAVIRSLEKIPVLRKLVTTQFRLKAFVCVAVLAASYISFNATYLVISSMYRSSFIKNADEVSDVIAHQIHNSMLQLMQRGWTRDELKQFLASVKGSNGQVPIEVELFRGEAVERDYGRVAQPGEPGRNIADSFRTGQIITFKPYPLIINVYPIKAEEGCLKCHPRVRIGEVLGVMKIRQDISPAIDEAQRKFNIFFFMLLPIPFLMAAAVATFLNARIRRATVSFHEKVSAINSVKDLTKLGSLGSAETGFAEFNTILGEFTGFADRIRDVAVDREVLEIELRVLEKFIITSKVVNDWKEHVLNLLLEINEVIKAYTLFSVFQIDEESYDIEVFWTHTPSKEIKAGVEKFIRSKVTSGNQRFAGATFRISHNFANGSGGPGGFTEDNLELQTKSLIVDHPRIGGVMGIGVQSEITKDAIGSLVIEGMLTTLLNVVGSIKAMYKYTKDLEYYATRDPLTNLYNQRLFWELLGYEIGRAQRHDDIFAVLVIDLDNFKDINDSHGHVFGDRFLAGIAGAIHSAVRDGDILARYGGDEFVAVLPEADEEQVFLVATRILQCTGAFSLATHDGTNVKATVSIGFAVYPLHASSAKDLFMFADNMMYKAKSGGKNTVIIPSEEDVVETFRATGEMTRIIMNAVEKKAVLAYFQPIINVETGAVEGHEVLSRIKTDTRIMEAEEFIEVAERLGIVSRHDYVVMEKVFSKVKEENYTGYLFLNLSPKSLILNEFLPSVLELTRAFGIDPGTIVFEITERDTVRNLSLLERFVQDLKSEGFMFAIDDFGSGFSSFNYIKRFPIDFLKIEGEFTRNIANDAKNLSIVKTMAILAGEFGIKSIVESIENEEQLKAIKQIGINYCQGYHTGRPGPELKGGRG